MIDNNKSVKCIQYVYKNTNKLAYKYEIHSLDHFLLCGRLSIVYVHT